MKLEFLVLFLISTLVLFLPKEALAQAISSGVAVPVTISEGTAPEGSLVCSTTAGYALCNLSYDSGIFGVVTTSAAAEFTTDQPQTVLVLSGGNAVIRVSSANGAVATGDLLTSSQTPGIAQKADRGGYVVGTALEPFEGATDEEVGEILVSINIHPTTAFTNVRSNLLEALRQGLAAPVLTPLAALRYILAAFVVVTAFILSFVYFGRIARTGIEAIARNPLASRKIELTIFFNVILMALIVLVGFALAYLILAL